MSRNDLHDESGQTLILGALFMVAVLVLLGLVIDVGAAWTQRRSLQNDADAAALAGAQLLPDSGAAQAAALDYAAANVSDLDSPPTITFGDNLPDGRPTSIRVEVHRTSSTNFLAGVGIGNNVIGAHAKAMIRSAQNPGPGVFPVAVDQTIWNYAQSTFGTLVVVKAESKTNPVPGRFGLLDFGSGKKTTCEAVWGGSPVGIVDPQPAQQGNESALKACMDERMAAAQDWNCFALSDILDVNGVIKDHCNPFIGARIGADPAYPDAQPTAVIVIPVITNFVKPPDGYPLLPTPDNERQFAFFYLHPVNVTANLSVQVTDTSVTPPAKVNEIGPTCSKNQANSGQCQMVGQFLQNHNAAVMAGGVPVGDFDPNSVAKVVQLVE